MLTSKRSSIIARRMSRIDSSGIRKVFDLGMKMKDPINLSIGQPDFDVPEPVKEEAVRSIRNGYNRYTVTQGIPELHDEVRNYYCRRFDVDLDKILITSAVSGGMVLAYMALVDPGDEVIIFDPYFVMSKHLVSLLGGVPVFINTYPDFQITREALESRISNKTKIIAINSPCNPTGKVMSAEELRLVADVAEAHDLLIITDEIYEQFNYDTPPDTVLHYADPSRVLLLNGLSKSCAMTGWRVGYVAGPEEIITEMTTLQQYSFVCAPSFAQKASIVALNYDNSANIAAYKRKRDLIYDGIKEYYEVVKPGGAFYMFPKAPGDDATRFCQRAFEKNLLIIPGNVFSEQDAHFRIAFAATDETLERGVEVLRDLATQR